MLRSHHFWLPPRFQRRSRSPEGAPYKTLLFGVRLWPKLSSKSPGRVLWRGELIAEAADAALLSPLSQGRIILRKISVHSTLRYPQHTSNVGCVFPCLSLSSYRYRVLLFFISSINLYTFIQAGSYYPSNSGKISNIFEIFPSCPSCTA